MADDESMAEILASHVVNLGCMSTIQTDGLPDKSSNMGDSIRIRDTLQHDL